ncbi:hypothetical protein HML84_05700 [Alcanivorax sp. IO_7]|nr:hypothetical protein HML84_05700 [Alcanivorax sp. IO_7]
MDDEQVPATLLVDGRYLTVDPEPEHLDPSQNYTLTLTGDLASTYGANLTEQRFRFRPLDTSPRGSPPSWCNASPWAAAPSSPAVTSTRYR